MTGALLLIPLDACLLWTSQLYFLDDATFQKTKILSNFKVCLSFDLRVIFILAVFIFSVFRNSSH